MATTTVFAAALFCGRVTTGEAERAVVAGAGPARAALRLHIIPVQYIVYKIVYKLQRGYLDTIPGIHWIIIIP